MSSAAFPWMGVEDVCDLSIIIPEFPARDLWPRPGGLDSSHRKSILAADVDEPEGGFFAPSGGTEVLLHPATQLLGGGGGGLLLG